MTDWMAWLSLVVAFGSWTGGGFIFGHMAGKASARRQLAARGCRHAMRDLTNP